MVLVGITDQSQCHYVNGTALLCLVRVAFGVGSDCSADVVQSVLILTTYYLTQRTFLDLDLQQDQKPFAFG